MSLDPNPDQDPATRLALVIDMVGMFERMMERVLDVPLSTLVDIERFRAKMLAAAAETYRDAFSPEEIDAALVFYEGPGRALLDRRAQVDALMEARVGPILTECRTSGSTTS